ncbi:right-handed parallel beta-helix repeat-containing protein [Nannocystis sp. SCPEA4]|uniref:right-handed parallel beta-helix repeat-containing protein n=1 Tax=Nannocystis sp. SCPEA4 TaxID=2996787 RepID=UPI002271DAD6|nr:right-handed parallel beta-helix repeat-containing protein [Nannocystis sp. SCPEA4]MCY1062991.1 right-handed parallel beta-helix repeat-containing protein [Nannocystis sp. SCPEA4]
MRLSPAHLAFWLGIGVSLGAACPGPSGTTTDGTGTTTESPDCPIGSVGCQCTPGGTCDGALVCASKICVPLDETSTGVATETASEPTSGDTSAGECEPMNEQENGLCGAAEPYCSKQGECVACSGITSCAAIDPSKPACDADSGYCVACTANDASGCTEGTPICDPATNTCHACTHHEECSGGACDLATGACFPAADTLWVDGAGDCDDAAGGGEDDPLCTISEALSRVAADAPRAILVRPAAYGEPLVVPASAVVAVVRVGAGDVEITGAGDEALAIGANARVYLDGLEIRGNDLGSGVGCNGGELLWIDRSLIRQHNISGVAAVDCEVRVRASVLTKNLGEGLFVSGGSVRIENTFISDNGDKLNADNPRGGLALAGGAQATLVYATLVGNNAYTGGGLSVECDPDAAAESIELRNSIAFNAVGYSTFNCEGVEVVTYSAFSAGTDDPNDDNVGVATAEVPMLIAPDPGLPGVYRPMPGTKLDAVAQFASGDPDFDFEGDPRPTDELSFPGADQPPP